MTSSSEVVTLGLVARRKVRFVSPTLRASQRAIDDTAPVSSASFGQSGPEDQAIVCEGTGFERLMSAPGIGLIISSAMVAAIGYEEIFAKGPNLVLFRNARLL